MWGDQGEFVAALADQAAAGGDGAGQPPCDGGDVLVAGGVPEVHVDRVQAVDVGQSHRDRGGVAGGRIQHLVGHRPGG